MVYLPKEGKHLKEKDLSFSPYGLKIVLYGAAHAILGMQNHNELKKSKSQKQTKRTRKSRKRGEKKTKV